MNRFPNLNEWSDNEILEAIKELSKESEVRANRKKESTWNKVREAIAVYVENYGEIALTNSFDTYYINDITDFDTIGIIEVN